MAFEAHAVTISALSNSIPTLSGSIPVVWATKI